MALSLPARLSAPVRATATRVPDVVRPAVLLRALALAVLVVAAAAVTQVAALVVVGLATGDVTLASGGTLLATTAAVRAVQYGTAALAVVTAVLAVLSMAAQSAAGGRRTLRRAVPHALRSLPRLLLAHLLLAVAVVVGVLAALPLSVGLLVTAAVLRLRARPGVRRALLLAIPLAPALVALGTAVTAVPAALSHPRSVRALLRHAVAALRSRTLAVAALVALVAGTSLGLTGLGEALAAAPTTTGAGSVGTTAALVGLVALLLVVTGCAFAVLLPPTDVRTVGRRGPRVTGRVTGVLRHPWTKASPIAVVTVVAMMVPLLPATGASAAEQPASASSTTAGGASSVVTQGTDESAPTDAAPATDPAVVPAAPTGAAAAGTPAAAAAPTTPAPPAAPAAPALRAAPAPTATTIDVLQMGVVTLGEPQEFAVDVAAVGSGAEPTGTVEVRRVDQDPTTVDEVVAEYDLADPTVPFLVPTARLKGLSVPLRFSYVPADDAFAGSEQTVTVDLWQTQLDRDRAGSVPLAPTVSYGQEHAFTVAFTSPADADGLTLEVRDQADGHVVTSVPFDVVDGKATVVVDLTGELAVGHHDLLFEVPSTTTHQGLTSELPGVDVTLAATGTELTLRPADPRAGDPVDLGVLVTTADGDPVTAGWVAIVLDGTEVHRAEVADGRVDWTWPGASFAGDHEWRVRYEGLAGAYRASSATVAFEVAHRVPADPGFRWSDDLVTGAVHLDGAFVAAPGLPVPTGTLRVTTLDGELVGRGVVDRDGSVHLPVSLVEGVDDHRVAYSGDATWQATTWTPAPHVPTTLAPTVTLDAPDRATLDSAVTVAVTVGDVPERVVTDVELFRQLPGQPRESVGRVPLRGGLTGSVQVVEREPGAWRYTAVARFAPGTRLEPVTSAAAVTTWSAPVAPEVSVTLGAGPHVAGVPVPVTVTVGPARDGGPAVAPGTTATVTGTVDGRRATVGSVVLAPTASGLSGTLEVTRPYGGSVDLVATVPYGTRPFTATSAPTTLTTAAPAGVVEVFSTGVPQAGTLATFLVRYRPPVGALRPVAEETAIVTVGDRTFGLVLRRQGFPEVGPYLSAELRTEVLHASDFTVTASVGGDGVLSGPASGSVTTRVDEAPSVLRLDGLPGTVVASGLPLTVRPSVANDPRNFSYRPTGTVTLTAWPSGARCTVPAEGAPCTLPAEAVVSGPNTLVVEYAGDADHRAASETHVVTGSERRSTLEWSTTPESFRLVAGEPATFTWRVGNGSAVPPKGRVEARLGSATCSADVSAGRCTLTVPLPSTPLSTALDVTVLFESADDAAGVVSTGTTFTPKDCLVVTVERGTLTGDPATACDRGGRAGFLTGTEVTARHDTVEYPWAFDGWRFDGAGASTADEFRFDLTKSGQLTWTTRWAPVCHTLELDPVADRVARTDPGFPFTDRYRYKGSVHAVTPPNCADPRTPTPEALEELAAGRPRYATGTVVQLMMEPVTTAGRAARTGETPYVVDRVTGATADPTSPGTWRTTVTTDQKVSATFKARDCVVVDLRTSEGGTIAVTSSTRPEESSRLRPSDGSCTDAEGRKGHVPGSTVTVTATPDEGRYFVGWRTSETGPVRATGEDSLALATLGDAPRGVLPGRAGAVTRTFVVPTPSAPQLVVGAGYATVHCVAVTTTTTVPVGPDGRAATPAETTFTNVSDSDSSSVEDLRCGRRGTGQQAQRSSTLGATFTQTDWFVGTSILRAERPATMDYEYRARVAWPATDRTVGDTAEIRWSLVDGLQAVADPGRDGTSEGPVLYLDFAPDDRVAIGAEYSSVRCVPVRFTFPQGGAVKTSVASTPEVQTTATCPSGSGLPHQAITIQPDVPLVPGVRAVASVGGRTVDDDREWPDGVRAADGRRYTLIDRTARILTPTSEVRIEYCVPLEVTVATQDRDGSSTTKWNSSTVGFDGLDDGGWADIVAHDGGCPPLWARPGSTVTVGLTDYGALGYDLVGEPTTVTVPLDGRSGRAHLELRSRCATLSLGDRVAAVNGPNCDHDASKYVLGTPVQLQADVPAGGHLRSWSGTDADENETAWVVVTKDRTVTADVHVPDLGEKILNGLSSVAQRTIALGAVVLTGIMLMEATLLKVLGTAMSVVSTGLKAVGVSGKGLDEYDRVTAIVTATTGIPSLYSKCISNWAHGPSLTQSNIATKVGAPSAVFLVNQAKDFKWPKAAAAKSLTERQGVQWVVDSIDAFGSGSYRNDARDEWSRMGSSLGTCMVDSMKGQVEPIIKR